LGNENSNCVIPPSAVAARAWLARLTETIRQGDERARVTVGLHMEDLEEDRRLGPREAAGFCDFLSMHGYPIYASWADGPTDFRLLPFLARISRWLGSGQDVVFTEFGLPTYRADDAVARGETRDPRLVEEATAAVYTLSALEAL